jgi:predicted tellurium resistance membrane protein TerC
MDWITDPQGWLAFGTLLLLEVVLGIDNVVFISILAGKLPESQQNRARNVGLALAMFLRIALLFSITLVMSLTEPLFNALGHAVTGRDVVLIAGGLFLVAKSTHEIHQSLEGVEGHAVKRVRASFMSVIIQILLLDIVFSLDSVITAVGMAEDIGIMISAVVVAVGIMVAFAAPISRFVDRHPTVKMLALSFLLLIGVTLIADGWGQHISKGYIYFAMAFSLFVEMLNLRMRRAKQPVQLHDAYSESAPSGRASPLSQ